MCVFISLGSWIPILFNELSCDTTITTIIIYCLDAQIILEALQAGFCVPLTYFFFFLINLFIYFIFAALGLRCCMRGFSSCGQHGLLFIAVRRLLIEVASLVVEHGLWAHRLQ